MEQLHASTGPRFRKLNVAFGEVLRDYSLVSFVPLNLKDDDSVALTLAHIDNAIQYGEDAEPKDLLDDDEPPDDVDPGEYGPGVTPSQFFSSAAAASGDGAAGAGAGAGAGV